jgi:hypothetical protein
MTNSMITQWLTSWANRAGLVFVLGWVLIALTVHVLRLTDEARGADILPYTVSACNGTCTELRLQDTAALIEATLAAGENACALPGKIMREHAHNTALRAALFELARALPIRIEASQGEITVFHATRPLAWVGALPDQAEMARRTCMQPLVQDPQHLWFAMLFAWGALNAFVCWRFRKVHT